MISFFNFYFFISQKNMSNWFANWHQLKGNRVEKETKTIQKSSKKSSKKTRGWENTWKTEPQAIIPGSASRLKKRQSNKLKLLMKGFQNQEKPEFMIKERKWITYRENWFVVSNYSIINKNVVFSFES